MELEEKHPGIGKPAKGLIRRPQAGSRASSAHSKVFLQLKLFEKPLTGRKHLVAWYDSLNKKRIKTLKRCTATSWKSITKHHSRD